MSQPYMGAPGGRATLTASRSSIADEEAAMQPHRGRDPQSGHNTEGHTGQIAWHVDTAALGSPMQTFGVAPTYLVQPSECQVGLRQ